jgi:hypothetical protein
MAWKPLYIKKRSFDLLQKRYKGINLKEVTLTNMFFSDYVIIKVALMN